MKATTSRPPLTMKLASDDVELSVIVPLFNEHDNVAELYEQLDGAMRRLGRSYEILFVNDGSTDGTQTLIDELVDRDPNVVAIRFPRNFGQTAALLAGIDHSVGRVIVPMDGDLQNDPNDIARLLKVLDEGYDVVSGWRTDRQDPWTKILPSRIANALISRASGVHLHDYGCSLKAYRREVIEGVDLYGEMHRFVPIYATWRGARVTEIPVAHHPRRRGKTKYGLERVVKVLLDLVVVKFLTSYLTKPIYVFGGFGIVNLALSALAVVGAVFFKLMPSDTGWHKDFVETPLPIAAVGLFLLGIQMVLIGLLAEMVMRTYYESQGKRAYVVSSIRRRPRRRNAPARKAG